MGREIKKGATDQTIYLEILDSASTTGGRKTGLVFNSAGMTAYYVRNGASAVAITLATLAAANSAHSDGGFKEVDATNMPGIYRLDLPDAAVASGAESVVVTVKGATGAAQVSAEIQLATNIASDVIADTDDIQARLPAALVSGRIDASVGAMAANVLTDTAIATDAITAAKIAANAIGASELATDAVAEIADAIWDEDATAHQTQGTFGQAIGDPVADTNTIYGAVVTGAAGATIAADIIAVQADTDNIQTRIPAALVSGRIDASVGAMAANVLTATAIASDAITAAKVADGTIDAATFAAGAINATAIAADAIGASELAADAVAEIADAVWDELLSGHAIVGSAGASLQAAGSAGDPWSTLIPGVYGAGSAGFILGTNIDATVSSRASQTSVDDLPTNGELATALGTADDAVLAAVAALNNLSAAQVNAEVVDALATDTYAEPSQGTPAATTSLAAKINYLYKAWRNKKTQTATTHSLFDDAGTTVDQKSTVSDDGATATRGEMVTGP